MLIFSCLILEEGSGTQSEGGLKRGEGEGELQLLYVGNEVVDVKWPQWGGSFWKYEISRDESVISRIFDRNTTVFRNENASQDSTYTYSYQTFNATGVIMESGSVEVTAGDVQGTITMPTVWKATTGSYDLVDDVTVEKGGNLQMSKGLVVNSGEHLIRTEGIRINIVSVTFNGRGPMLSDTSGFSVVNSIFNGATAPQDGIGIHLNNSNGQIIGNTIINNKGGGIYLTNGSNPTVHYNNIYDNGLLAVNNIDQDVTVDARFNYFINSDETDPMFSGNVDYDWMFYDPITQADILLMNGYGLTDILNNTLSLQYSVTPRSNTSLTVARFQKAPRPTEPLENATGDYYVASVNKTNTINYIEFWIYYLLEDVPNDGDEEKLVPYYWDEEWLQFSNWELKANDNGIYGGYIAVTISDGVLPPTPHLEKLVFGLASMEEVEPVEHIIIFVPGDIDGEIEPSNFIWVNGTLSIQPYIGIHQFDVLLDGVDRKSSSGTSLTGGVGEFHSSLQLPHDLTEGNHTITLRFILDTDEYAEKEIMFTYTVDPDENPDDNDDDKDEDEADIAIYAGVIVLIVALGAIYLLKERYLREDWQRYKHGKSGKGTPKLLPNYVKRLPGMEHRAGVQPGGTFLDVPGKKGKSGNGENGGEEKEKEDSGKKGDEEEKDGNPENESKEKEGKRGKRKDEETVEKGGAGGGENARKEIEEKEWEPNNTSDGKKGDAEKGNSAEEVVSN